MTRLDDELVGLLRFLGDPAADYTLEGEEQADIEEQLTPEELAEEQRLDAEAQEAQDRINDSSYYTSLPQWFLDNEAATEKWSLSRYGKADY